MTSDQIVFYLLIGCSFIAFVFIAVKAAAVAWFGTKLQHLKRVMKQIKGDVNGN
jgi:hypothetical protein